MRLYTTELVIEKTPVSYLVSNEGERLLFRPCTPVKIDAPIFWVAKNEGQWKPINIEDEGLIAQILSVIKEKQVQ